MVRLSLVVVALLAVAGCKTDTGCDGTTAKEDCPDAAVKSCMMSNQCTNTAAPACDTATHACVQCFGDDNLLCTGKTPVCTRDKCAACTQHTDCKTSAACLPDGSCAAEAQVAYVDPAGTDNATCSKAMPCTKVMAALTTRRPYVKFRGTTDEGGTINIAGQNVTLLADPGATLTRTMMGTILQITGTSTVEIDDLQISGGKGPGNSAILIPSGNNATLLLQRVTITGNEGIGINDQAGSLSISRSTISSNTGGGIFSGGIAITFNITNSFIYRNGDSGNATVGGVSLIPIVVGGTASHFEFNTVVDNQVKDSTLLSGGVLCDQDGFMAPNNLIARNLVGGMATKPNANMAGACGYLTSTLAQTVTGLNFKASEASPYDYHIQAGSSVIGKATTPSTVTVDFDNDPRPANAGDQGADQYKP